MMSAGTGQANTFFPPAAEWSSSHQQWPEEPVPLTANLHIFMSVCRWGCGIGRYVLCYRSRRSLQIFNYLLLWYGVTGLSPIPCLQVHPQSSVIPLKPCRDGAVPVWHVLSYPLMPGHTHDLKRHTCLRKTSSWCWLCLQREDDIRPNVGACGTADGVQWRV